MYTIIDYLKYYKDSELNKINWNIMDNLMCSILAYLPLKSFIDNKDVNELDNYSKNFEITENSSVMIPKAYEILNLIKDSKRYQNLIFSNFINIRDDDTQFGAVTIRVNDKTIISYKGTDGSLIGWIENFRIAYDYPTYTHTLAINYLKENIKFRDKNIYVVGHSKGGNLAMVSSMETTNQIFNKIIQVCNFDGPGFRTKEFISEKYNKLSKKLINISPTGSVVGILLNNNDYNIVKSNALAFDEHYPTSWNIFGQYFIAGELSNVSLKLHQSTTSAIENLDCNKVRETFETIFQSFEKEYNSNVKMSLEDMLKFYRNMKSIDPEISKYIDIIIDSMLSVLHER